MPTSFASSVTAARGARSPVECARDAIGEDPASARARVDDIAHALEIETRRLRQREGLGAGREVRAGEQVVDDLERRCVARARSQLEHAAGDAVEDSAARGARACVSPDTIIVIVPAAAFAGPPDTGASRSAMPAAASRGASAVTYAGSTVDDTSTMRSRAAARATPSAPNSTVSTWSASTTSTMTMSHASRERGRRVASHRAVTDRARLRSAADVPGRGRDAGAHEALHDAAAHGAGADDADARVGRRRPARYVVGTANGWQSLSARLDAVVHELQVHALAAKLDDAVGKPDAGRDGDLVERHAIAVRHQQARLADVEADHDALARGNARERVLRGFLLLLAGRHRARRAQERR